MSLELTLHTPPAVPLEAETLTPDRLKGLSQAEITALSVFHGNEPARMGDFFEVSGRLNEEMRLLGDDLHRVKLVGAGMETGRLILEGDAGMHLGAGMRGGEIIVEGSAGDWVGAEMLGGRIIVQGDAGHMVGGAYRGSPIGMQGGEIIIHGGAKNEVGNAMRRGLIAIGGDCGDFAAVNMLAGSIIVLGKLGWRPGAGMKRGTVVAMKPSELLPTFTFACRYRPIFLRIYLNYLRNLGLPISKAHLTGLYQRWSGDSLELNRGEILLLDG